MGGIAAGIRAYQKHRQRTNVHIMAYCICDTKQLACYICDTKFSPLSKNSIGMLSMTQSGMLSITPTPPA